MASPYVGLSVFMNMSFCSLNIMYLYVLSSIRLAGFAND